MNPPQRLGFRRRRRISRSSDFNRLKEEGRREVCGTLILNWLPSPQLRLGIVTSRNVGPATIRSRARRLLREVFRQHQHQVLEPVSMVLVARRSIAESHLETVRRDYLRALSRARLIKAPPATPASPPPASAPVVPPPVVP